MNTPLFTHRAENKQLAIALTEYFAAVGPTDPVGLVYTPAWCGFARLEGDRLSDGSGSEHANAFEVRLFSKTAEFRWRKEPTRGDMGTAALVTEQQFTLAAGWEKITRKTVIETNELTYLLWGEKTETTSPKGWSVLATARIGGLPVPLTYLSRSRVVLHAIEYITEDEFGSAFVFEERLTHLAEK
jgi:CRISPR-associated protein (TIGR03984 family)